MPVQRRSPVRRRGASNSSPDAVHSVPRSSRFTKKSLVSVPGLVGEDAERGAVVVRAQDAQAADQDGQLRSAQRQQVRAVEQQVLGRQPVPLGAGSCGTRPRSAPARRRSRRRSTPASRRCGPGVNGTSTVDAAVCAAFSTAAVPPRTIRSASETGLPKPAWMLLELAQHLRELRRVVDLPAALRLEADAGAVGAAALVAAAERRGRRPRDRDQLGDATARSRGSGAFSAATSSSPISRGRPRGPGPARSASPTGPPGRGSAAIGPMSRWVSLNQARANASASSSGCSWKRREIVS